MLVELNCLHDPGDGQRNDMLARLAALADVGVMATSNVQFAAPAQARLALALAAVPGPGVGGELGGLLRHRHHQRPPGERFLSDGPDRPPNIHLDIEHGRREEVIQHVYGKYGQDRAPTRLREAEAALAAAERCRRCLRAGRAGFS